MSFIDRERTTGQDLTCFLILSRNVLDDIFLSNLMSDHEVVSTANTGIAASNE